MTRFFFLVLFPAELLAIGLAHPSVKVNLHVVDGEGTPVTSALVCYFLSGNNKDEVRYGKTDAEGVFSIEGRCAWQLGYHVKKDGFYGSSDNIVLVNSGKSPLVRDGMWQPYDTGRKVLLKPMRNPVDLLHVRRELVGGYKIPVLDKWVGFDFMKSSWCPPYGRGEYGDVLLRFTQKKTGNFFDCAYSMDVCFTNNPHAGFYILEKDLQSELKTTYLADPAATFLPRGAFVRESHADGTKRNTFVGKDSYCVFRTRTQVDKEGKLIRAHYGIVQGEWSTGQFCMNMGDSWINPIPNDTNLESSEVAERARRGAHELFERMRK